MTAKSCFALAQIQAGDLSKGVTIRCNRALAAIIFHFYQPETTTTSAER